jgi:hypothetical protein
MHIPGLTLGYREYSPTPTNVLYADEQKSLTGKKFILKRENVDIVWVRVSQAVAYLTFKDRHVKTLSSYHDFYGFLASVRTQIDEAPDQARSWKIEQDSELELHVLAYLEDSPTLGYEKTEYGRRYYKPIDGHVWRDSPQAKVGEEFSFETFPYEERQGLSTHRHTASVVWKSSNSNEGNAASFATFETLANADQHVFTETGIVIPE